MDRGLLERLKQALESCDSLADGQLQMISLNMVRAKTGDRWISVRKKIYDVAHHFIEKRLGASDVIVRCRGGFIVVFSSLAGDGAMERAGQISDALNCFFLGDEILKNLNIRSAASTFDINHLSAFMQPAAEPAGAAQMPDEDDHVHWVSVESTVEKLNPAAWASEAANARRSDDEGAWTRDDAFADRGDIQLPAPDLATNSAQTPAQNQRVDHVAADHGAPRPTARSVDISPALDLAPAVFTDSTPFWDDIVFKPCWDAANSAITTYFCLPRRVRDGLVQYGRDTLQGTDDPNWRLAMDKASAIASQRAFQNMYAEGVSCAIAISVHYRSIQQVSDRVRYFSILQSVPQHLRRYFFLRVDGIPNGAPVAQLSELFRSMKCFGSRLLADVPFGTGDLSMFDGAGIDLIGSEVPVRINRGDLRDADFAGITRQVEAAHKAKAETFLTTVGDLEALSLGISAGVRFFVGRAIADDAALPGPVRECKFEELRDRAHRRAAKAARRAAGS